MALSYTEIIYRFQIHFTLSHEGSVILYVILNFRFLVFLMQDY